MKVFTERPEWYRFFGKHEDAELGILDQQIAAIQPAISLLWDAKRSLTEEKMKIETPMVLGHGPLQSGFGKRELRELLNRMVGPDRFAFAWDERSGTDRTMHVVFPDIGAGAIAKVCLPEWEFAPVTAYAFQQSGLDKFLPFPWEPA